ncbi:hypothetical protein PMM47T1_23477 [Pseudomonas sp. M47T1]|uniref:hypothetical protein n=1 Tax=Pseudomonas sp. M47T1 TaxID=1179778 RepID=UPI000260792A|nr:hypothetical protein [Pseudomonas sp. M47T1]EIK94072.1 hypothetical protein PMM47T1_23477 [Pseudomonas sp. M47T1]
MAAIQAGGAGMILAVSAVMLAYLSMALRLLDELLPKIQAFQQLPLSWERALPAKRAPQSICKA